MEPYLSYRLRKTNHGRPNSQGPISWHCLPQNSALMELCKAHKSMGPEVGTHPIQIRSMLIHFDNTPQALPMNELSGTVLHHVLRRLNSIPQLTHLPIGTSFPPGQSLGIYKSSAHLFLASSNAFFSRFSALSISSASRFLWRVSDTAVLCRSLDDLSNVEADTLEEKFENTLFFKLRWVRFCCWMAWQDVSWIHRVQGWNNNLNMRIWYCMIE